MRPPLVKGSRLCADAISRVLRGIPEAPCPYGCPAGAYADVVTAPEQTAPYVIYAFFGYRDQCLYVGQTRDIGKRVSDHLLHYEPFAFHAREVVIVAEADTRAEAHCLERANIRRLRPQFNIIHSTDRGFGDALIEPTVVSGRRSA